MSDSSKHRARLWLRGERAFGLTSVPAAMPLTTSDDRPAEDRATDVATPPAVPARDELPRATRSAPAAQTALTPAPAPVAASIFGGDDQGMLLPSPTLPPFEAPVLAIEEKRARLAAMDANEVTGCTKCRLCETRTKTVFGEGDADAKIFFIGEGPGENEDLTGRPFVGKAGELLNKMIGAMGLRREQVFISNIVKCRPPGNREPAADETGTCTPYLLRQLEIVRPRAIVTLGRPSSQYMLQSKLSMSRLRGQWHDWRGIKLMPTYHPAYVLRNYTDQTRAAVWSDLQQVMAEVGLPAKKGGA